jgi:hypothetical protein
MMFFLRTTIGQNKSLPVHKTVHQSFRLLSTSPQDMPKSTITSWFKRNIPLLRLALGPSWKTGLQPIDTIKTTSTGSSGENSHSSTIVKSTGNQQQPQQQQQTNSSGSTSSGSDNNNNTKESGNGKEKPDYDMFKPEASWGWSHPMTFAMLIAVGVLHYLNDEKVKEKENIEADARRRGVILEPKSWDYTLSTNTDKWSGSSYRLSSLPRSVEASKFVDFIKQLCNERLPTSTAYLEKIKFDRVDSEKKEDGSASIRIHLIFQTYDPQAMKTQLHRLEGFVDAPVIIVGNMSPNQLAFRPEAVESVETVETTTTESSQ